MLVSLKSSIDIIVCLYPLFYIIFEIDIPCMCIHSWTGHCLNMYINKDMVNRATCMLNVNAQL